jgi:putative ABC transport system ATP-binding protein
VFWLDVRVVPSRDTHDGRDGTLRERGRRAHSLPRPAGDRPAPFTAVTPALLLSKVTKIYSRGVPVTALRDLSFSVARGTRVAVMGPSGSGKSTLLNLTGGLDVPTSGTIAVGGVDLAALNETCRSVLRRSHVGYIFQAYHLLPTLTCAENVAMPLYLQGRGRSEVAARVARALADVGLTPRAAHLPDELSGGERQRAAIARALVIDPHVLLADEPTGNLDCATGDRVLTLLSDLTRARGATLVLVTHNLAAAERCDRLIRLRDGCLDADSQGADV